MFEWVSYITTGTLRRQRELDLKRYAEPEIMQGDKQAYANVTCVKVTVCSAREKSGMRNVRSVAHLNAALISPYT